jgi:hypothetical protein
MKAMVSVNASVRQTILGLEAERIAAMVGRDLDTLEPLLADDLSYAHSSGRRDTKASFLELVRSGHYLGVDFPERDVVLCGDAVIVRGRAQMQVSHGADPLSYPILFLETYALRGERWQLVAWQATRAPE